MSLQLQTWLRTANLQPCSNPTHNTRTRCAQCYTTTPKGRSRPRHVWVYQATAGVVTKSVIANITATVNRVSPQLSAVLPVLASGTGWLAMQAANCPTLEYVLTTKQTPNDKLVFIQKIQALLLRVKSQLEMLEKKLYMCGNEINTTNTYICTPRSIKINLVDVMVRCNRSKQYSTRSQKKLHQLVNRAKKPGSVFKIK